MASKSIIKIIVPAMIAAALASPPAFAQDYDAIKRQQQQRAKVQKEQIEAERAAAARVKQQRAKVQQERKEAERAAAEKADRDRETAERAAAEKAEQQRKEAERAAVEKAEQQRKEAERAAVEKADRDRERTERGLALYNQLKIEREKFFSKKYRPIEVKKYEDLLHYLCSKKGGGISYVLKMIVTSRYGPDDWGYKISYDNNNLRKALFESKIAMDKLNSIAHHHFRLHKREIQKSYDSSGPPWEKSIDVRIGCTTLDQEIDLLAN